MGEKKYRDFSKYKVMEYLCEKGATRRGEFVNRGRWRLFCCDHQLGGCPRRDRSVRAIER